MLNPKNEMFYYQQEKLMVILAPRVYNRVNPLDLGRAIMASSPKLP